MDKFEALNKTFQACVGNANAHLSAAKDLRGSGHNNMAFNAAVLALEEMGKAVLIGMKRGHPVDEESDFIRNDWFDDHSKKLFWALWSTFFGTSTQTLQNFQDFPHMANRIHRRRLDGIYMDPGTTDPPERIKDEDVDDLIGLAEYALAMEGRAVFQEVDGKDRTDLEWFIQVAEDPKVGGVIFGKDSFARLNSLNGDVRQWVQWLRTEIDRIEAYNRALEDEEINRASPPEGDALNPKWSVKVRLHSWSHSIRPKSLAFWNKKSPWVKLAASRDKKEMLAEFLVPGKVMMGDLWRAGTTVSQAFTLALNVATRGFFWWYLPAPTDEFFEEIRDLERNVPLGIVQPSRVLEWGNHTLSEADLEETGRVYMYLQRIHAKDSAPYSNYIQALALLAKSDAHGRFEPTALQLFYQSFRGCALQHGDWDGTSPFAAAALKALELFRARIVSIDQELPRHIQLGEILSQGGVVENLTVRDTIMMKLFCDLYISRIAHEALGYNWSQPGEHS